MLFGKNTACLVYLLRRVITLSMQFNYLSLVTLEKVLYFGLIFATIWASMVAQMVKYPPAMQETWVWSLSQEDPLEKGMATHSNILSWRILWTEELGRLQSIGSQRVGRNWSDLACTRAHNLVLHLLILLNSGIHNSTHSLIFLFIHLTNNLTDWTMSHKFL